MTEGRLITFEGPDGGGKSTQLKLLAARLRDMGREVVETAEPGGTRVGQQIRNVLLDARNQELSPVAELLLYFASRAQNVDQCIRPALARGAIVLADRYTDSTLVYQGIARGLGESVVLTLDAIACRGVDPHLTLLLDVDPAASRARMSRRSAADRLELEPSSFHDSVRRAYLELAAREPGRIRVVDASGGIDRVAGLIWTVVEAAL